MSPSFIWDDAWQLGVDAMDGHHHEFVECVARMMDAPDDGLPRALAAFIDHASRHFAMEDLSMRETAYGSAGCHVDEHAAVLRSAEEVRLALGEGRTGVVRAFARALADWFPEHAKVMDQGLARWLVQRELGGAPVVIRRSVPV